MSYGIFYTYWWKLLVEKLYFVLSGNSVILFLRSSNLGIRVAIFFSIICIVVGVSASIRALIVIVALRKLASLAIVAGIIAYSGWPSLGIQIIGGSDVIPILTILQTIFGIPLLSISLIPRVVNRIIIFVSIVWSTAVCTSRRLLLLQIVWIWMSLYLILLTGAWIFGGGRNAFVRAFFVAVPLVGLLLLLPFMIKFSLIIFFF